MNVSSQTLDRLYNTLHNFAQTLYDNTRYIKNHYGKSKRDKEKLEELENLLVSTTLCHFSFGTCILSITGDKKFQYDQILFLLTSLMNSYSNYVNCIRMILENKSLESLVFIKENMHFQR